MTISLTVAGVDRTAFLVRDSFEWSTDHYGKPDGMHFTLQTTDATAIAPTVDSAVVLTIDSVVKFSGRVLKVSPSRFSVNIRRYAVEAIDWSRDANKGDLIAEIYKNMTVNAIIADVVIRYPQLSGFTTTNVNCAEVIDYAFYGHVKFTDFLTDLANRVAYNFYIDASKNIHFFLPGSEVAPYEVTETNAIMTKDSLNLTEQGDKIVNLLVVEGDEYDGNAVYTEPTITADGTSTEYSILEKYSGISLTVAGVSKTVGTNGLSDATAFDALYDYPGKKIVFRSDNKPTAGQAIVVSGYQKLPVLVKVLDPLSIAKYEILPKKIKNTSLKTIVSAKRYAQAELARYAGESYSGSFKTTETGFRAGQKIKVTDSVLGFSQYFYVQRTSSRFFSTQKLETSVTIASAEEVDTAGILARLLNTQNTATDSTGTINQYYSIAEKILANESLSVNANQKTLSESVHLLESSRVVQDATIQYVLGPYSISGFADTKRPFCLDGSPLV
ncbi:MAG: hypothetical protein WCJ84_00410 [Candidatus Peregrinibacteria bacterium]